MFLTLLLKLIKPVALFAAALMVFQVLMGPTGKGVSEHIREYAKAAKQIETLVKNKPENGSILYSKENSVNILCKKNRLYEKCEKDYIAQQGKGETK